MSTINHHPQPELLEAYAKGELFDSKALLIAAHAELCPTCSAQIASIEADLAQDCFGALPEANDLALTESLLAATISSLPDHQSTPAIPHYFYHELQIEHRRFSLPRVLARQLNLLGSWSNLPGKLQQAKLQLKQSHCFFIHMDKNAQVPQHTHSGNELTLVLHGGFADDLGEYRKGDFIQLDDRHQHQPFTDDHEDCLVISALDAPLHFTSGLSKLLNPLSQLFFR